MNNRLQSQQCNIDDIQDVICGIIKLSDQKRQWFANTLGISRQALAVKLKRQTFSISDIQKVCSVLGYKVTVQFVPK